MVEKRITIGGTLKKRVTTYLEKYPRLRDSDQKLIANIWFEDLGGKVKISKLTGKQILEKLSSNLISNQSSIIRCRAKLQEEFPELRGDTYSLRKGEMATRMATEVNKFNQND